MSMQTFPQLDPFTLLVCGNVLLLALALTLSTVSSHHSEATHALHIWIASLLVFVLPGTLFIVEMWVDMPVWFPPKAAGVVGALLAFTVMQQLAALQISRGGVTWRKICIYCGITLVVVTGFCCLLPTFETRGMVLGVGRMVIPFFTLWLLMPLMRGSRGARVLFIATALGQLFTLSIPAVIQRYIPVQPAFLMCADIAATFISTLGILLWHQEHVEQRLTLTAMTDALTGVLNRHGLMPRLEQELARAARTGRPVAVVLCDLDHFKRVNDTYGHNVGDLVLRDFAQRACGVLRRQDIFGRWGGEEFLLVLPDTSLEQAVQAADRLRMAQEFAGGTNGLPKVTLSAGVACAPHGDWGMCSSAQLLDSADHLLYAAKETRNRVISLANVHREPQQSLPVPMAPAAHKEPREYADTLPPTTTC
jgi:diguanylate cyclase (GGDEF)-like protein